jgi:hypothetical protein
MQVWLDEQRFGLPADTAFSVPALRGEHASSLQTSRVVPGHQHSVSKLPIKRQDTEHSSLDVDSEADCKSPAYIRFDAGTANAPDTDATALTSPEQASPNEHSIRVEHRRSLTLPNNAAHVVPSSFLGVRRLLAEISDSAAIVTWLDNALDACSHMVNLREVIGAHRGGPMPSSQMRPEFSRLRHAFERDAVALARYCLLITYAAYLHHNAAAVGAGSLRSGDGAQTPTGQAFNAWVASMSSVKVWNAGLNFCAVLLLAAFMSMSIHVMHSSP